MAREGYSFNRRSRCGARPLNSVPVPRCTSTIKGTIMLTPRGICGDRSRRACRFPGVCSRSAGTLRRGVSPRRSRRDCQGRFSRNSLLSTGAGTGVIRSIKRRCNAEPTPCRSHARLRQEPELPPSVVQWCERWRPMRSRSDREPADSCCRLTMRRPIRPESGTRLSRGG